MVQAILIHENDNVAVVIKPIADGETVTFKKNGVEQSVVACGNLPVYHKIAVVDIEQGQQVCKYNSVIGVATSKISAGMHAHSHNVVSASLA